MTLTARPLRKDAERNRQLILDAARELFAERGLGVTLNDIAHHAGVGVGTVYRRFPDKAKLIDDLFEQRMGQIVELAHDAIADPDPWHGLIRFLERALELQACDRGFKELVLGAPGKLEHVSEIRRQMFPLGTELVRRAREAGQLRPDFESTDIPIVQLMLSTVIDVSRDVEPELWRRYLAIVIQGLRADPVPPDSLPVPALEPDRIDNVMAAWVPQRR